VAQRLAALQGKAAVLAAERAALELAVAAQHRAALQVRAAARQVQRVVAEARAEAPPRAPRNACRALTSRPGPTATVAAVGLPLA
jgi:hypothetical protein